MPEYGIERSADLGHLYNARKVNFPSEVLEHGLTGEISAVRSMSTCGYDIGNAANYPIIKVIQSNQFLSAYQPNSIEKMK